MSVQAGVWNLDGNYVGVEFVKELSESLKRQGEDGEQLRCDGPRAFLYRPFHTTAESRRELQPHLSRNGCVITWDGRVDNRDELIAELQADIDPNPTDVSIIAAAFDVWGVSCFKRIIGDWAVTIWNPVEQKLILARDYVGTRQLYYLAELKRIAWCTNLAALVLLARTPLTVNDRYFASYLFLWPEAHLTPYREIQQVAPGGYVQITNEKIVIESYWTFDTRSRIRYKSDADYEAHFRHVFCESVRRRLRSDTPILAELSGGLDSSSIVCVADDIIESEGLEIRLDTTSRYDPCDPGGDERRFFSRVEERRGRAGFHVDKSQGPLEFPLEFYEFVAVPGSMGNRPPKPANNPFASNGDSGHRVLLSGTGGDEVLGGIPDPRPQLADLVLTFHWGELARQLMAWSLIKRRPLIHLLGQSLSLCVPLSLRICTRDEYKPVPWLHPRFLKQHWFAIRELSRSSIRGRSLPVQRDYAETIATLSRQMCLTSAHPHAGQERRYPYLDQSLVQFLFSIPAEQLLRPGQRRSLMRRALANIVPNEILSRSTKAIGGRVYMAVFENQWQRLEKLFAAPISAELGYINARAFVDALRSAKNGDAPHLVRLLRAIALEVWLQDLQNRGVIRVSIPGSRATHETSFRKLVPG